MIISAGTAMLTDIDIEHRLNMSRSDCIICDYNTALKVEKINVKNIRKILVGTKNLELSK